MDDTRLRCLIVDDEPPAVSVLQRFILATNELVLTATATHAIQAFEILHRQPIDVLFLDINLPRLSGIDFLRSLKQPPKVIFTTAHREFAADGFELDAVDYLVKPIALDRFLRAVDKLTGATKRPGTDPDETTQWQQRFIYFRVDRNMVKIMLDDILYVESLKDYIKIITPEKSFIVNQSLSAVEKLLPASLFCRIHRSFIVSKPNIKAYNRNTVTIGVKQLPIGRLYRDDALKQLSVSPLL